MSKKRHKNVF